MTYSLRMLTVAAVTLLTASFAHAESKTLFDGKTLEGWSGNPELWSVVDGVIVGAFEADGAGEDVGSPVGIMVGEAVAGAAVGG